MEEVKDIPINIWDDFYDDGYVPEGEKLETFIYVEDTEISLDDRKKYLEVFLEYINSKLNTEGIKLWIELYDSKKKYPNLANNPDAQWCMFERWEIKVEGLTHKRLDEWMSTLKNADISMDGLPFRIYSES